MNGRWTVAGPGAVWALVVVMCVAIATRCMAWQGVDRPSPFLVVVMDPLAARLSCPCVEGYAQRDYDALARHLEASLGRPVRMGFAESLPAGLEALGWDRADMVIGKDSVVRADAAGDRLEAVCMLTDLAGGTQIRGLFVVPADDEVESLDEAIDYAVYVGSPEHAEKHAVAIDALRRAGLPDPFDMHEFDSCSDAAAEMLDLEQPAHVVAVISSYAQPLLEGCGTVPRGALRVIGETEPVRFITAFVDESLDYALRDQVRQALLAVGADASLCAKLESSRGFLRIGDDDGWPGWRGPQRRGHAPRLPQRLPRTPAVIWSQPLVRGGLGGVAATRSHVVLGDRDDADERDVFRCFDADTGESLWEIMYEAHGALDYGNSPRATPLIDHGRVYLLGAMGDLHCVELATGKVRWKRHLARDFDVPTAARSAWGYCASPLLADGRLIVGPGAAAASVVALDPATGDELWRAAGRPAGFSSFVAAYPRDRCQVIGFDDKTLGGWDIATGRRLWEWKPPVGGGFNVPTPVILDGDPLRILVTTETDGTHLLALQPDGTIAAQPLATSEELAAEMVTPVSVGECVVCVQDRLVALNAADSLRTVTSLEDATLATYAGVVSGPSNVLVIGNGGRLMLLDVTTEGCRVNSTTTIVTGDQPTESRGPIYSHPAFVGTRVYVRGAHALTCVDLAAEEAEGPAPSDPQGQDAPPLGAVAE